MIVLTNNSYPRNDLSSLLLVLSRSFLSAFSFICLTRSRVSPYLSPISSSVSSGWFMPKQASMTLRSLALEYSFDLSYLRFYLKNVLPRVKNGCAFISNFSFFTFFRHSSCGFFESLKQFKNAKKWVNSNQYRFSFDLQGFLESWKI